MPSHDDRDDKQRQKDADSITTVSTNLVALYKALGGGWENSFPRETD